MALTCASPPEFGPNERVVLLVYHLPEIKSGVMAIIVSPRTGSLYAVQLPNGELHSWFAGFELEPVNTTGGQSQTLRPGSLARVISTEGHASHIKKDMIVRVVKVLDMVPFYDLMIDGKYHRWIADFEVAPLYAVQR
ncbi:MAG: hypothetical protein AAGU32_11850 [Bacillota bacterium]